MSSGYSGRTKLMNTKFPAKGLFLLMAALLLSILSIPHPRPVAAQSSFCLSDHAAVGANSGRYIAFNSGNSGDLYFYDVNAHQTFPVNGLSDLPAWSWDGQRLAFDNQDQLV